MSVQRLITELNDRGVRLSVEADLVNIDAPKGVIADADIEQLKQHKEEVIKLLTAEDNVLCFLCQQPVIRGTPGTGALAGRDCHMDCYWKQYPIL